jgi:hypothetical protein
MERMLLVNENMRRIDEIKQKTSYYVEALEVRPNIILYLLECTHTD